MSDIKMPVLPNTATVDEVVEVIMAAGGVIIENFLDAPLLQKLKADLDAILARTPTGSDAEFAGVQTRRAGTLFARTRYMADVALHPLFKGAADKILRKKISYGWMGNQRIEQVPDIRIGVTQVIQIGPGQVEQPLHRDDFAFFWEHQPGAGEARLQVMVAITDFTAENGATHVIPESHKWDDERMPTPEEAIQAEMAAGSALLFIGSTYHGGGANRTADFWRTGLTMTYDLAQVRQEENLYLALPVEVVKTFSEELQTLLGWSWIPSSKMGWIEIEGEMCSPIELLHGKQVSGVHPSPLLVPSES
ncbi:MAG: phytanoyl-CoA dioxygenase family protein [Alphaproteobacteria bacterium]|nr:phytanoyl-CoA dioxygenase family protein [Alphaproteobacteria bacterium]